MKASVNPMDSLINHLIYSFIYPCFHRLKWNSHRLKWNDDDSIGGNEFALDVDGEGAVEGRIKSGCISNGDGP